MNLKHVFLKSMIYFYIHIQKNLLITQPQFFKNHEPIIHTFNRNQGRIYPRNMVHSCACIVFSLNQAIARQSDSGGIRTT